MSEETNPIDPEMRERLRRRILLDALYSKMIDLKGYLSALTHREETKESSRERSVYVQEIGQRYDLENQDDALIELWRASQEVSKLEGNIPEGIALEDAERLARSRGLTGK